MSLHKYYTVSVKILLFLKGKEKTGSHIFRNRNDAFEEDVTYRGTLGWCGGDLLLPEVDSNLLSYGTFYENIKTLSLF